MTGLLMQTLQYPESHILSDYRRLHARSRSRSRSPRITMGKMAPEGLKKGRQFSHCVGCGGEIHDQYILRVAPNLEWHAACLKCNECQMFLDENCTCFVRDGKTFCKKDYARLFGAKCEKCCRPFAKQDFVMRAKSKIFHMECFRCVVCNKQLVPGDEFAFRSTDGSLFCKDDHAHDQQDAKDSLENNNNIVLQHNTSTNSSEDNSEAPCDLSDEDMSVIDTDTDNMTSASSAGSKKTGLSAAAKKAADRKAARARTVLSEKQLNILKTCYSANPRPDALMKEQLVEMTGLSPRVIRVWFQNKRCKDKKLQSRMMEKQLQQDGRKMGYGGLHGIPMVATSPVRHDSPGMNPVEIQSFEPPWKALNDFALHADLEHINSAGPHFQHIVNQMHGYPDLPPHGSGHDPIHGPHLPHPHLPDMPPFHHSDMASASAADLFPPHGAPPGPGSRYLDACERDLSPPLPAGPIQAEAAV